MSDFSHFTHSFEANTHFVKSFLEHMSEYCGKILQLVFVSLSVIHLQLAMTMSSDTRNISRIENTDKSPKNEEEKYIALSNMIE